MASLVIATAVTASMSICIDDAGASPSTPRVVSAKPTTRYLPVAGTSKVLVYAKVKSAKRVGYDLPTDAVLFALTTDHKKHRLGKLGDLNSVTAAGSSVDISNVKQGTSKKIVRWWDFATDKHGTMTTKQNVQASPDGWIYVQYTSTGDGHVYSETYSGHVTDLGAPLPTQDEVGVVASSNGVLAYGDSDDNETDAAEARYMPWSDPGHFRTLYNPKLEENYCPGLTSKIAVCAPDEHLAILPLGHGTNVIKSPKPNCATRVVAFHTSAIYLTDSIGVGNCPDGQLGALLKSGKVNKSTARFAVGYLQAALGRIVVASKNQKELLALKGAQKRPKTLVK